MLKYIRKLHVTWRFCSDCLQYFTTNNYSPNSSRSSGTVINSLDASMLIMYINRDSRLSSFITAHLEQRKYLTGGLSIIQYFAFSKIRRLYTVRLSNGNIKTFEIQLIHEHGTLRNILRKCVLFRKYQFEGISIVCCLQLRNNASDSDMRTVKSKVSVLTNQLTN